jgi:hypothetical protein
MTQVQFTGLELKDHGGNGEWRSNSGHIFNIGLDDKFHARLEEKKNHDGVVVW